MHGPGYSIWSNHGLVKVALDSKEAKYADEWAAALNEVYKPPPLPGIDDVVEPGTFDRTASSSTLAWDPILEAELFGSSTVIALPWDWSR